MERIIEEISNADARRISALNERYASCAPKNALVAQMREMFLKGKMLVSVPYRDFARNIVNQKFNRTHSDTNINKVKKTFISRYETYGHPFINIQPITVNVVTGEITDGGGRGESLKLAVENGCIPPTFDVPVYLMCDYAERTPALTREIHIHIVNWNVNSNIERAIRMNDQVRLFFDWVKNEPILTMGRGKYGAVRLATIMCYKEDRYAEYFKTADVCPLQFNMEMQREAHKRCEEIQYIAELLNNITDATHLCALTKAWIKKRNKGSEDFEVWKKYLRKTSKGTINFFSTASRVDVFEKFFDGVIAKIKEEI